MEEMQKDTPTPQTPVTEGGEEKAPKAKKPKTDKKTENELAALRAQIEEKEAALAEEKEKYLRLAAEYDNFRRRSKAEHEATYADAYADVIKEILPVLDNIERAAVFTDGEAAEKIIEGVQLTAKGFADTLAKLGVTEVETKIFDPNFHNAVMHIDDDSYGEGEIVEVFQKGYQRGDRVIRYAMVKVAN